MQQKTSENVSAELDRLLQASIHTRRRKPEDPEGSNADLDKKLQQMNKAVALSDPFVNYIIHHESKRSRYTDKNSCQNKTIVGLNVGYQIPSD